LTPTARRARRATASTRSLLKPSMPTHNVDDGLPITDEIELELALR
jgi:hypothetical protein